MIEYSELLDLLHKAQNGDNDAKSLILEHNSPLIKSIVKRYRNKGTEYEDLYQLGAIGMTKAINNFDESFGVKFSTYAVPMIAGEIKRFLRDDGLIKVSRSIKSQYIAVQRYINEYQKAHNSSPSPQEIANHLNIDEADLMFVMEASKMPVSIYTEIDGDKSSNSSLLVDKIAVKDECEEFISHIAIKDVLKSLSKQDKLIVGLRYFRDKTQSEVATLLKVSQVQVSRLENKILSKIKNKLKD